VDIAGITGWVSSEYQVIGNSVGRKIGDLYFKGIFSLFQVFANGCFEWNGKERIHLHVDPVLRSKEGEKLSAYESLFVISIKFQLVLLELWTFKIPFQLRESVLLFSSLIMEPGEKK
jgi:hypothetical protein